VNLVYLLSALFEAFVLSLHSILYYSAFPLFRFLLFTSCPYLLFGYPQKPKDPLRSLGVNIAQKLIVSQSVTQSKVRSIVWDRGAYFWMEPFCHHPRPQSSP